MGYRWTAAAAHAYYDALPWQSGCNFAPSYAINQLEMWQEETFDIEAIDAELALAASVGMNAVRVYLHDLLWLQDSDGFLARMDRFLARADAHGIRSMFVLFDSCWDPDPVLGPQRAPKPGVHNSGWVQAPGMKALADPDQRPRLEAYVRGVVGRFSDDHRILAWDIWNEPDNGPDVASCDRSEWRAKGNLVRPLMEDAFAWARESGASQPLTSAIWMGNWSRHEKLSLLQRAQIDQSDIISFHNYGDAKDFARRVKWLGRYERPVMCSEYMARPAGSTFQAILPIAQANRVGMFCWGLVRGKTQTHLPWANWISPLKDFPADAWFHDIFDADGSAHDEAEVEFLRWMHRVEHYAMTGDPGVDAVPAPADGKARKFATVG
jgi:hypothetical protein